MSLTSIEMSFRWAIVKGVGVETDRTVMQGFQTLTAAQHGGGGGS